MATLQKIPPLIDRFAMDDKLNMLADGVNNLVDGFGPYLDKAIDAAQDAEQAAEDATNAAQGVQAAIDGANTAAQAANAAAGSATSAANAANTAAEAATGAAGSATSAASAANEAASAANTAAEAANEAVAGIDDKVQEAVNERVLAKQYGPASVISASGVCENVPVAGMKVYGKTQQNLWPVMEGKGNAGINVTANSDGSITVVAQRSGQPTPMMQYNIDTIVMGKTYTLTVDPPVDPYHSFPPVSIYVSQNPPLNYGEGTFVATKNGGLCTIKVNSMDPVNQTFRIMLNEGEEGEPFCPPGITSVSELGVVSAGKNLLKINSDLQTRTKNGMTFTPNEDGTVTVNGTATDTSDYYLLGTNWNVRADNYLPGQEMVFSSNGAAKLYGFDSSGSISFGAVINGGNQIISAEQIIKAEKIVCYLSYASGQGETNKKVYAQLELGSEGTAYEPPSITTTPVDLSGHQLRSLPDGTRDVLTVDGSGACKIEQQVGAVTFDGSTPFIFSAAVGENNRFAYMDPSIAAAIGPVEDLDRMLCDTMPVLGSVVDEIGVCFSSSGGTIQIIRPESTVKELQSWMESNPTTVIFDRRKTQVPDTFAIDPITPPTVLATDATLWAASNVTTDIEASLWEPFAEEGGAQQKALIEVAKSLLNFANNEEMKVLNAQFADNGVAIRKGNLYVVIAQGPERTEDNLEIVTTKEIPLKANDPQVCLLKTRAGQGNGEFIHETINIPGQDPSFYIRTGSTPNGYELLFVAYIA